MTLVGVSSVNCKGGSTNTKFRILIHSFIHSFLDSFPVPSVTLHLTLPLFHKFVYNPFFKDLAMQNDHIFLRNVTLKNKGLRPFVLSLFSFLFSFN